jgi:hypothetical protein
LMIKFVLFKWLGLWNDVVMIQGRENVCLVMG